MTKVYTGPNRPVPKETDGRLNAPSAARNQGPILEVLRRHLPETGTAIEFASGSGQHIAAFAEAFPGIHWTPTDAEPERLPSIEAWRAASGRDNLGPPLHVIVGKTPWPFAPQSTDATLTVNMLHLVSPDVVEALFSNIAPTLKPGGLAFVYGPFKREGQFVSDGDRTFDETLRAMDPAIGYKDRDWVAACAVSSGLRVVEWVKMPANNLMLVAVKQTA